MLLWKLKRKILGKRKPYFPVSGRTKIISIDRDSVELSILLTTPADQVINYRADDGKHGGGFRYDEHRRILFRENTRKIADAIHSLGVPLGRMDFDGNEAVKEPEYVDMIWRFDDIILIDGIDVSVNTNLETTKDSQAL
jgi:hypothetical protein